MTWVSKYTAIRNELLIPNVSAVITRDFKSALDVLNPVEAALPDTSPLSLPDFREKALGQVLGLEFPCLAIRPRSGASSPSEDAGRLGQAFKLYIEFGVTDDAANTVTNRIMKYVSAMEGILLTASKNDFFAGMPGQVFGFVPETEYEFGPIGGPTESILFRGAQLRLTITVNAR